MFSNIKTESFMNKTLFFTLFYMCFSYNLSAMLPDTSYHERRERKPRSAPDWSERERENIHKRKINTEDLKKPLISKEKSYRNVQSKSEPKIKKGNTQSNTAEDQSNTAEEHYKKGVKYLKQDNFREAFDEFVAAAKNKHPGAEYGIGVYYEFGILHERNLENALLCYKVAKRHGKKDIQEDIDRVSNLLEENK